MTKRKTLFRAEIPGLPPSVNDGYRGKNGGWGQRDRYKSSELKEWQKNISVLFSFLVKGHPTITERCGLEITIYTKNMRVLDVDNRIKHPQDCLAMGGVIKNDHLIWDTRIKRILDREHEERTVIELYKECRVPVWVGRKNLSDRASSVRNILLYPKAGISLALDETREYAEDHAR